MLYLKKLLVIILSICILNGMDDSLSKSSYSQEGSLASVLLQLAPESLNVPIIEKGFGKNFDFESHLNPDGKIDQAIYLQRLNAFGLHLFEYTYGLATPRIDRLEPSGTTLTFLTEFFLGAQNLKFFANFMPIFEGKRIEHFIPEKAINCLYFKVPINVGHVAIIPQITPQKNGIVITRKVPCYLITEPDAESLCLALAKLQNQNISLAKKLDYALSLHDKIKSQQAKVIFANFVYNFSSMILKTSTDEFKTKNAPILTGDDQRCLQHCCVACPHLLKLEILQKQLINSKRLFDSNKNDIAYDPQMEKTLAEIQRYIIVFEELSREYADLFARVQEKLISLAVPIQIQIEPEKIESPHVSNIQPAQIEISLRYAKRTLRWFQEKFASKQRKSSIFYHTALPLEADNFIIRYGNKTEYHNKTHIGQVDSLYTISGKIIDEKTGEEYCCLFHLTHDPSGICYHRGCKKCTWDELNAPSLVDMQIEELDMDEGTEEASKTLPIILQETDFTATISNPLHNYKIVLYKEQFN